MRISDWSSDVCSSDLHLALVAALELGLAFFRQVLFKVGNRAVALDRKIGDLRRFGWFRQRLEVQVEARWRWFVRAALCRVRRSASRRVGHECVSTFQSWWSPVP